MKTLNLRSMSWIMALAMMFIVSFTGCSDDDEEGASAPVFPESKSISCNAGETKEFTFDANLNWKLTSTAIWCKFVKDGADEVALSGSAGKQTITIKATDDDQKPGEAGVAKIELEMGNKKEVIAEVTRSAIGFELKIYDAEGKEIKQLELGYQTYIPFKVKANFRFAASDFPEWVALENGSLVGVANKEVQGGLKIVEDQQREKYPIEANDENAITFSDEAGKASFSFPVFYKGMTPGKIDITKLSNNPYDWVASLDGKTLTQGEVSVQDKIQFTVKTFKDEYEIVLMEKWTTGEIHLIEPSDQWIHYTKDKGTVDVTIDELVIDPYGLQERTGYVIALTKEEYESIKDNIEDVLTEKKEDSNEYDIVYKYGQANLLVAFTQKEIKDADEQFRIKLMGYLPVEYSEVTNEEILGYITSEYGVDKVYSISAIDGGAHLINPLLSAEEWEGDVILINEDGDDVTGFDTELGSGEDGGMYYSITIPQNYQKNLYVIFKGTDGTNKKALMIITKNGEDTGDQHFTVSGGTFSEYNESDVESLKTAFSLSAIYKATKNANDDHMFISMIPSPISTYKVYDLNDNNKDVSNETEIKGDELSGTPGNIVWKTNDNTTTIGTIDVCLKDYGDGNSIADRKLLIVVTCEDDTTHGIVVSK